MEKKLVDVNIKKSKKINDKCVNSDSSGNDSVKNCINTENRVSSSTMQ